MEVFSSDIRTFERLRKEGDSEEIHYKVDIRDFDVSKLPFQPDIVWASPPCTTFSVASCWKHYGPPKGKTLKETKERVPKTKEALEGIKLVKKTFDIIEKVKPRYWFVENPRGMLRTRPFMQKLVKKLGGVRNTVTYCAYGDYRMKPTDIFTNLNAEDPNAWKPRSMCKRGDPCHDPSPRGSNKGGVMRQSNSYERSRIPHALCLEILAASKRDFES
jgi:hypothetical protein